jgi:superfamily I DNA and/or RNA helicase
VVKNVVAGAQVSASRARTLCVKSGWLTVMTTQVVLSTCHGAGSRQINNMDFDVCIIDEVSGRDPCAGVL